MKAILTGALAMLLFSAPLAKAQGKDASEEEAIKQTLVAMWDAIEDGDVDRYASYADYLKRASGVHTEMHQPEVSVKGDVAWITYYWTDSGMSGGERFTSRGKSTRIFVKEDGKWLCIHGHNTAVP